MVVPPACAAEGASVGSGSLVGARVHLHAGDEEAMFAVCAVVMVVVMVFGAGEGSPFSALLG